MVPIAEALRLSAEASGRRSDLAFPAAAAAVHDLAESGAAYFPLAPFESTQFAQLRDCDPRYATHEYLGGHFRPLMFDAAVAAMRAAGCVHLGGIEAVDHLPQYWAPPELVSLLAGTEDSTLRGILRDLVVQRPLRRDIFRRGLATTTLAEHEARLHDLVVVGSGRTLEHGDTVGVPVGAAVLDPAFYQPLLDVLAESPLGLRGIAAVHPRAEPGDVAAALGLLVHGGYAIPVLDGDHESTAAARRFNQVLVAENAIGNDHRMLVSPAATGAIASDAAEIAEVGQPWSEAAEHGDPDIEPRRARALRALGVL
jgi:hypothetical protein